jgi:hypothetical protein
VINFFPRYAFARKVRKNLYDLWSGFDKATVQELFQAYGVENAIRQQYDKGARHSADTAIIISVFIVAGFIDLLDGHERAALIANPGSPPFGMALAIMDSTSGKIASDVLSFRLHAEIDGRFRGLSEYQIEEGYKHFLACRST